MSARKAKPTHKPADHPLADVSIHALPSGGFLVHRFSRNSEGYALFSVPPMIACFSKMDEMLAWLDNNFARPATMPSVTDNRAMHTG